MKIGPGIVSIVRFPQSDLREGKYRPVIVLSPLPGPFNDWLICAATSQLHHEIKDWDELISPADSDFVSSGLKAPSLIRIGKLATVESGVLEGVLGKISEDRLKSILAINYDGISGQDNSEKRTGGDMDNSIELIESKMCHIPQLAVHHRMMFEEIWENRSMKINIDAGDKIQNAYAHKLMHEMPAGVCISWGFEDNDRIIASGAITIVSLVPVPHDLSSRTAYLHSVFTEKKYRNKGLAGRIAEKTIEYCRTAGIKRIFLNASDAGKALYENLGFVSSPESMRLFIE
jgi:GNAT superfamily N-acetyltransferase